MDSSLKLVFKSLKSINYCAIRDESFFDHIVNDDIDLVVPRKDIKKLNSILNDHNYYCVQPYFKSRRDLFYYSLDKNMPPINIHIDRLVKLPFLKINFNKDTVRSGDMIRLNDKLLTVVYLLKDSFLTGLFGSKPLSQHKISWLITSLKNKSNLLYVQRFISKYFIGSSVISSYYKNLNSFHKKRLILRLFFLLRSPFIFSKYFFNNLIHILFLSKLHSLKSVAFLGVDGSGKSTSLDTFSEFLSRAGYSNFSSYMGRWGGFTIPLPSNKNLSKGFSLSMNEIAPTVKKKSLFFHVNLFLRDSYFCLDYTFRLFSAFSKSLWSNKIVLYDRYVYDLLVMKNKTFLLNVFVFFYPKPQNIFLLYNDSDIIFKRKGELNPRELARQQSIFKKILPLDSVFIRSENEKQSSKDILKSFIGF